MKIMLSEIFSGTCTYMHEGCDYILKTASDSYADEIYGCYADVNINDYNISEKLNVNSTEYFGRCGGIFSIPSRAEVSSLIDEGEDVFIVSESKESGQINAMLHLSIKESDIYKHINFSSDLTPCIKDEICRCGREGRFVYPLEYVSVNGLHGGGTAYPMLKYAYDRLKNIGFKYALVEIYTVLGYEDDAGNWICLNCTNNKSVTINKKIGGINVGCLNNRAYCLSDKTVYVRPDIYVVELEKAVKLLT